MELLTIRQFAKSENIPEAFVRRLVKTGQAPGMYSGTRFYVNADRMREVLNHANASKDGEAV